MCFPCEKHKGMITQFDDISTYFRTSSKFVFSLCEKHQGMITQFVDITYFRTRSICVFLEKFSLKMVLIVAILKQKVLLLYVNFV